MLAPIGETPVRAPSVEGDEKRVSGARKSGCDENFLLSGARGFLSDVDSRGSA
jgi:hypothetical protein